MVRMNAVPKTPLKYWTSPEGYKVPLDPKERQLLAKGLDEAVTVIGQRLVRDPSYQNLPDNEEDPRYQFGQKTKEKLIKGILDRYRGMYLKQIMPSLKAREIKMYRERQA
jgi:hypothetical protein